MNIKCLCFFPCCIVWSCYVIPHSKMALLRLIQLCYRNSIIQSPMTQLKGRKINVCNTSTRKIHHLFFIFMYYTSSLKHWCRCISWEYRCQSLVLDTFFVRLCTGVHIFYCLSLRKCIFYTHTGSYSMLLCCSNPSQSMGLIFRWPVRVCSTVGYRYNAV